MDLQPEAVLLGYRGDLIELIDSTETKRQGISDKVLKVKLSLDPGT
jgi:hypothetical protein